MFRALTATCLSALAWLALASAETPAPDIEAAALRALTTGSKTRLAAVAEDIRDLPSEQRAKLTLRVRSDAVEFRFRGESPGDQSVAEMLEYVVSDADKAHESLLIVGKADLARLQKIGRALASLKRSNKPVTIDFKLVWVEDGRARVEDLEDIVATLSEAERKQFLEQLVFQEHGFGGSTNVKADVARLPARRVPAELLICVRLR